MHFSGQDRMPRILTREQVVTAARELEGRIIGACAQKEMEGHKGGLKSACRTIPEVSLRALHVYRRKLGEHGVPLSELSLYAEPGFRLFSGTIDLMFVLPYGEMQRYNPPGRGNFLLGMYSEIGEMAQKEISKACARENAPNLFRVVSYGASLGDVGKSHVLLGKL